MAIDSAPSAARVATKIIRTSRVAADRPRMIPRTLTMPSWLPRMKSDRTVGFGWEARSRAMFASMAGPTRGTSKPFSLEAARSYGPAAPTICPGPSRSAEGCSRTEAYKPPLVSGTVRPRQREGPAAEDPMANFRIENVVASTSLGRELDLKAIALALGGSEYEPEQFPGLIYRIKEPKTAILLFRSGKVVCTGAKSLENVKTAIDLVAKQIEAAGIPIKKNPEIEVQNIVATSDLGAQIDLNAVAITLGLGSVEYEPEQFPGLVYRIDEPKVVLLMFGSGKVVCTGARKPADVEKAVEKITAELKANGLLH